MTMYTRLVWLIMLYAAAQFLTSAAWLQSEATAVHHHQEITKRVIQVGSGSEFLLLQDPLMGDDDGIMQISKKTNRWCRRCLQIREEDELIAAPTPVKPADGDQAVVDPPMAVDLPTLPTDPEASTLLAPRTNPSSLLSPGVTSLVNDHNSNRLKATGLSSILGISASVGATAGVAVLIVGLLYYFKPDIFLCCKTCVRVQVFHHTNHASKQ